MKRALLVIDVQREYFEGAFPIRHPVGHLDRILEMMDVAKKANMPTVVIRHHQPDPESPVFRKGSDMWQLHGEVESRPRDVLIDKQLPGSPRLAKPIIVATKSNFSATQPGHSTSKTKPAQSLRNNCMSRSWSLSRCSSAM